MEGDPGQKCLVEGCESRMRRDGLCLKHLAARDAVRKYHATLQAPPVKGGCSTPADNDRIRRAAEVLAALGVVVIHAKALPDEEVRIEVANGLRVILDADDLDQFAALVPTRDGQQCASTTIPIPMYIGIGTALVPKEAAK